MTKEEVVVMDTSDEAASFVTVSGWVSAKGIFYGDNEAMARYDGCTHRPCATCGKPTPKSFIKCSECNDALALVKFAKRPRAKWDRVVPLYSYALDEYFQTIGDVTDAMCDGMSAADLMLVICVPNKCRQLDFDTFADDDEKLPSIVSDAIIAFNEAVSKAEPLSWSPGKLAVDLSDLLDELV